MDGKPVGLTARLADHVAATTFDSLPSSSVLAARRALLDGVGVMLAASGTSADVLPFVALARSRRSAAGATVLGHGLRVDPAAAALANGAMAHALDFEDAFDLAPVHPNASLIPAALAIAEAFGPVSGKDLLTSVAVGCDLVCRLGLSLRRPMEEGGWYPPPILGSFGAAAAAAQLMHLSPQQVADAFSLLLCQIGCPGEIKNSAGTVIRAIREAFPAQSAVTAAVLAKSGVRGFDEALEGKAGFFRLYAENSYDPSDLLDGLGERFWIERLSFKPWPACRGTHAYVEAVQRLIADHAIQWRDISEVQLDCGEVQQMLVEPELRKKRPSTSIDAKFSLPFVVAIALVRGNVSLDDFLPERLGDPDILAMAARITYRRRSDWGRERLASGAVGIRHSDGRHFACEILDPLGSPERPLTDSQLKTKFENCAARAARPRSIREIGRLAERLFTIDEEEDVASLVAELQHADDGL